MRARHVGPGLQTVNVGRIWERRHTPDHRPRHGGWPRLSEPLERHRGEYCYVAALLPGRSDPTPILRLRYQSSADHRAIAIYKASTGQYTEAELPGSFGRQQARQNKG